ncbi:MAG: hypothetical protein H0W48_06365 [Methylibium sp.]|nr:hypothetical protein [Methylibium sp.]
MALLVGSGLQDERQLRVSDLLLLLLTPHTGEMARPIGQGIAAVRANSAGAGPRGDGVATPKRSVWDHHADQAGLAASGSGDVLADTIAGLAVKVQRVVSNVPG